MSRGDKADVVASVLMTVAIVGMIAGFIGLALYGAAL